MPNLKLIEPSCSSSNKSSFCKSGASISLTIDFIFFELGWSGACGGGGGVDDEIDIKDIGIDDGVVELFVLVVEVDKVVIVFVLVLRDILLVEVLL